jgi:DNA-binding NtrC family response regulator
MQKDRMKEKLSKDLPVSGSAPRIGSPIHNTRGTGEKRTDVSRVVAIDSEPLPYVVGESTRMREIYTIIRKAAPWDANVCIEGENGTGKELVARAVHFSGPRRDHPFVTLDCSTIAEGLIESHLFGHVRGAFTGAVSSRQGVFAQAHTGTVFIDEITELAPHLQAKLLRVIQTGEFVVVGGSQPQRVNVRIITATNRDLRQAVARGTFREDLYFRIAVVHIAIPPLRERRKDIPLLVAHFLRQFMASGHRQDIRGLTPRAMAALTNYSWPGNVRQLKNWIEQALVLADGDLIDIEHFPSLSREAHDVMGAQAPMAPLGLRLEELERWYVLETLKRVDGNRTKAARQLGISLRGLQYKLRRYGTNTGGVEPDVPGGGNNLGAIRQWHERPGSSMSSEPSHRFDAM